MKYTRIPSDTFQKLQMNAGVVARNFNPATGEVDGNDIIGVTSGGVSFTATPTYKDLGEDVDNCPKNTMELKILESIEAKMSGTFASVGVSSARRMIGAADVDVNNPTHIIPRNDLVASDFNDMWWIGDYSDVNTGARAGYIAIHLKNALSTGGFQLQSTDKDKGKFAFEFTGHYSIENPDEVPYEIYVKGSADVEPYILISKHSLTIAVDDEVTLTAEVVPEGSTVTWSSSDSTKASVSAGVVEGKAVGSAIINASITVDGIAYTDTCTVIVTAE